MTRRSHCSSWMCCHSDAACQGDHRSQEPSLDSGGATSSRLCAIYPSAAEVVICIPSRASLGAVSDLSLSSQALCPRTAMGARRAPVDRRTMKGWLVDDEVAGGDDPGSLRHVVIAADVGGAVRELLVAGVREYRDLIAVAAGRAAIDNLGEEVVR